LKFNLARISGRADWVNETLTLTNVQAAFYGGRASGSAGFDFNPEVGTDYHFNMTAADARLDALIADLHGGTNNLEGDLSGHLVVDHANSKDWKSWQGEGRVKLRDGLIWRFRSSAFFRPCSTESSPASAAAA